MMVTAKSIYDKLTSMVNVGYYLTPAELKILESAFVETPVLPKKVVKAPAKSK